MRYLPMFLMLSIGSACLAGGAQPGGKASDERAIQTVIGAYQTAWNRHDAHAFSLIFAPDAEFVNVRGIAYPGGRAGIEKAHRPLFATMFRTSHVTTDRVQIRFLRPDVAAVDVYWRMTGSTDHAGHPRPLVKGLRNFVLTREHGVWQIAVFHNMETEPSPQKPGGPNPPTPSP